MRSRRDVDAALAAQTSGDAHGRLRTLVTEMFATMETSLPLGRKLIRLTVDAPAPEEGERGGVIAASAGSRGRSGRCVSD